MDTIEQSINLYFAPITNNRSNLAGTTTGTRTTPITASTVARQILLFIILQACLFIKNLLLQTMDTHDKHSTELPQKQHQQITPDQTKTSMRIPQYDGTAHKRAHNGTRMQQTQSFGRMKSLHNGTSTFKTRQNVTYLESYAFPSTAAHLPHHATFQNVNHRDKTQPSTGLNSTNSVLIKAKSFDYTNYCTDTRQK